MTSPTPRPARSRRSSSSPTTAPALRPRAFAQFIDSRPELTHIRTRRKSPQTNGVIERYHGAIKIEQLWRQLPADGIEMTALVDEFRKLYNTVRPHEALSGDRPMVASLSCCNFAAAQVPG